MLSFLACSRSITKFTVTSSLFWYLIFALQELILLLTYKKWIKVDNNYDCVGLGLFNKQILSNFKHFSLSDKIIFIYSSFLYNWYIYTVNYKLYQNYILSDILRLTIWSFTFIRISCDFVDIFSLLCFNRFYRVLKVQGMQ